MKKKFTIVLSMLIMAGMVWDYNFQQAHTNGGGAPAGHTGSPDDGVSCSKSGCHSGGPSQTTEAVDVTTTIGASGYVPGETYDITVSMTKNGGQRFGFQLSPQSNSGAAQGTLIAGTGTQIFGGNYMTHKPTSTLGTGSKSWNFQWTAPASGTGAVTFFGAFNFTNNSNTTSGDVIVTESYTVAESSVGIDEHFASNFSVYPNPVTDVIHVAKADIDEEIMITLFSVDGKMVYHDLHVEEVTEINVDHLGLNTGIYFLKIAADGRNTVKKLLIQ